MENNSFVNNSLVNIFRHLLDELVVFVAQVSAEPNHYSLLTKLLIDPRLADFDLLYLQVKDVDVPEGETLTIMSVRYLVEFMLNYMRFIRGEPFDLKQVIHLFYFLNLLYFKIWDIQYENDALGGDDEDGDGIGKVVIDVESIDLTDMSEIFALVFAKSNPDAGKKDFCKLAKIFLLELKTIIDQTIVDIPEEILHTLPQPLRDLYIEYNNKPKAPLSHNLVLKTFKTILCILSVCGLDGMLGASCRDLFSSENFDEFSDDKKCLLDDRPFLHYSRLELVTYSGVIYKQIPKEIICNSKTQLFLHKAAHGHAHGNYDYEKNYGHPILMHFSSYLI